MFIYCINTITFCLFLERYVCAHNNKRRCNILVLKITPLTYYINACTLINVSLSCFFCKKDKSKNRNIINMTASPIKKKCSQKNFGGVITISLRILRIYPVITAVGTGLCSVTSGISKLIFRPFAFISIIVYTRLVQTVYRPTVSNI